jgi:hypothetical protein
MTEPGPLGTTLAGAARLLPPALAVGAFVLLLLVVPGRDRHPALEAAEALHAELVDPDPILFWALRRSTPPGQTVLARFGDPGP